MNTLHIATRVISVLISVRNPQPVANQAIVLSLGAHGQLESRTNLQGQASFTIRPVHRPLKKTTVTVLGQTFTIYPESCFDPCVATLQVRK